MKNLQVVGAIFVQDGKVFAAKRGESRYAYVAYKYEFVGGKVEQGEDYTQALRRELNEEMALQVEVVRPYMTVRHTYPDFVVTLHLYICRMLSDYRLMEHVEAKWLEKCALHPDEWAPADAPVVAQLVQDLKEGLL